MNDPERPPLAPLVLEETRQSAYEIDQRYWPLIVAFRVARFIPPSIPVPPHRPLQMLEVFKSYAKELYEAEANRYESFQSHRLYVTWLSNLNNRIAVHLQEVFQHLEESDPGQATLLWHGIAYLRIDAEVRESMFELGKRYTQGEAKAALVEEAPESSPPARDEANKSPERMALRDAYRAAFPDVKIKDICWAAEQSYREWKRWIKGEAKNGLRPDRSFRMVLTSGKTPEQIRKQPRPSKYDD